MSFFVGKNITEVSIDTIHTDNDDFKISRPIIGDDLKKSLLSCGLLEPPVLLRRDVSHIIVFGHNRIRFLKEEDKKCVSSIVIDKLEPGSYMEHVFLNF